MGTSNAVIERVSERGGMWDMDTKVASTITSHDAGYLDKDLETIVGVQTEKPFKRSMQPFGGIRMAKAACEAYGYELDEENAEILTDYRTKNITKVYSMHILEKC